MCDTLVALPNATADGSLIFAKNSDRDGNEAHELMYLSHATHPEGAQVQCTYISIPQVAETYAVLLAKPFWIWGAEMGANEHQVMIGNEAIFSKVPAGKEPGLIGMDYLRLALERADTARKAVDVITELLERYGQSGNCGFAHPLYYHNSFLIADPQEAWVLETVDRHWAAAKVKDVRSISNGLTITNDYDLASADLVSFAIEKGWCKDEADFSFRDCYSDFLITFGSDAKNRQCRTTSCLEGKKGSITLEDAMAYLRDHGEDADADWRPDKGLMGAQVCMHLSWGPVRISQTTGSMVSQVKDGFATHWLTGSAAPCTSIFKPFWIDSGLPDMGNFATGTYDPQVYWWSHEDLHRAVLENYPTRIKLFQAERDALEAGFIAKVKEKTNASIDNRLYFSQACFQEAWQATKAWTEKVRAQEIASRRGWLHKQAWKKLDEQAKRPQD